MELAKNAAAAASSGIKELEIARKGILQALSQLDDVEPNQQAGAADVLRAAKGIADGVAVIVATSGATQVSN